MAQPGIQTVSQMIFDPVIYSQGWYKSTLYSSTLVVAVAATVQDSLSKVYGVTQLCSMAST